MLHEAYKQKDEVLAKNFGSSKEKKKEKEREQGKSKKEKKRGGGSTHTWPGIFLKYTPLK
jgi:hypothetical protein